MASLALLAVIGTGALAWAVDEPDEGEDSLYRHLSVFSEVLSLIRRTYVDETSLEELFAGALDGTTDALDSHSIYVPAEDAEAFDASREIGLGVSGVSLVKERGIAYVLAVVEGSPGDQAELETGDIVAEIGGEPTRPTPLWRLRALLAGAPGTTLQLGILRQGRRFDKTLTLAEFEWPRPALTRYEGVPVIAPGHFDAETAPAVRALLEGLEDRSLILDLRGLAGGSPSAAYAVAGLFAEGTLGRLVSRDEVIESFDAAAGALWSGRVVVLTNRGTQGAAEILATVLAQSAGAELVGQRTFGFAGRERQVELSTGARLSLADAFYTGPDGAILDTALEPDEAVNEVTRRLSEAEVPIPELILKRGIERLQGEAPAERQVA